MLSKLNKQILRFYQASKKTQEIMEKEKMYNCNNYAPIEIVVERAKGSYVYDVDGKQYLDCIAAYSAINQGHVHPKIKQAMIDQLNKVTLTSRAIYSSELWKATKFLCETFNYEKSILMNSGVEAGETAVKFARKWGYQEKKIADDQSWILFAKNNFWGRTIAACGSSDDPERYHQFGPYNPKFKLIDYNDAQILEDELKSNKNVAAYMLEPIQGEGGVIIPDQQYIKDVRYLCDKYNVLMILDEVQTGIARTGKLLCQENFGVKADLVCLGKALSGGFMPISAVLGNDRVFQYIIPGLHGSTFGGNPLACSVMIESLKVIEEENMIENSKIRGKRILQAFKKSFGHKKIIKDIRGMGLFIGIELDPQFKVKGKDLVYKLLDHNLLTKQTKDYILRLAPPLVIGDKEEEMIINGFDKVFSEFDQLNFYQY